MKKKITDQAKGTKSSASRSSQFRFLGRESNGEIRKLCTELLREF
jgi:hypothetical protein